MSHWYQHYHCLLDTAASSSSTAASWNDERLQLEDATGCVPLYLQLFARCPADEFETVWRTKFTPAPQVQQVYQDLHEFHRSLKAKGDGPWRVYLELVRDFIKGRGGCLAVSSFRIDSRYMYTRDGRGHFACGLARDCLVAVLRMVDADSHRTVTMEPFLAALKTANPSVRGFFIEQACVASILAYGLPHQGQQRVPTKIVDFDAGFEKAACDDATAIVLYLPHPFHSPSASVDAILRLLSFDGQQRVTSAEVVTIQVTLDQKHKHVAETFYASDQANTWVADLRLDKSGAPVPVEHTFAWIRQKTQSAVTREARILMKGRAVPKYTEVTIPFSQLSHQLARAVDSPVVDRTITTGVTPPSQQLESGQSSIHHRWSLGQSTRRQLTRSVVSLPPSLQRRQRSHRCSNARRRATAKKLLPAQMFCRTSRRSFKRQNRRWNPIIRCPKATTGLLLRVCARAK